MPDSHSLILFLAAALALNVTPGPDMLYVAARSTSEGRAAGIVSALGIAAGTLVHITAVALGLAAVLAAVPVAYTAVRLAGALYLIYLGTRALLLQGTHEVVTLQRATLGRVFAQGVLTNVLNPKVALFFLAFLPQFVSPAHGSTVTQIVALGLMFDVSGTTVNLVVALGASGAAASMRRRSRPARIMRRVTGGIFIAIGLRLALASRR